LAKKVETKPLYEGIGKGNNKQEMKDSESMQSEGYMEKEEDEDFF
jgi:hypothetical protein